MAKGVENLRPFNTLTEEEQREIRSKGGKKSVEVKRQRKTLKEELLLLLSQGQIQEKISLALLEKAMSGDTKAFEVIRDSIGEKPKDNVDLNVSKKLEDVL